MNTTRFLMGGCLAALLTLHGSLASAWIYNPVTYQGRLVLNGVPANGLYSFQFKLFSDATNAVAIPGTDATETNAMVSDGLFTVMIPAPPIGLGSNLFNGDPRWLEIGVCPTGSDFYTTLSPRQQVTATPYASFAYNASNAITAATATSVPWSALTGIPASFADGVDNDSTYTAGAGLNLSGPTFSVAAGGITSSMLASNAVTSDKIVNGGNIAYLDRPQIWSGSQSFTGSNRFGGDVTITAPLLLSMEGPIGTELSANLALRGRLSQIGNLMQWEDSSGIVLGSINSNGVFTGNGSGLSALNASALSSGTVPNSRLSGDIAYINQTQNWSGSQTFSGPVLFDRPSGPTPLSPFGVLSSNKVDNLNANYLDGRNSDGFWKVGGNTTSQLGSAGQAGTLGTLDDAPLDFITHGIRALRLYGGPPPVPGRGNTTPNLIAGSSSNSVSSGVQGASVLGGGGSESPNITNFPALDGNAVTGDFGTVAGGAANAAGAYSFAAGHGAQALHAGSFVWADNSAAGGPPPVPVHTTASNQFLIRATGGVGIGTTNPAQALDVRDGSGPNRQGGNIHVGSTVTGGDPKLIHFGDLQNDGTGYVYLGENGADDTMELRAARFHFNVGNVGIGVSNATHTLEIHPNGTTIANSWGVYSSRRWKTNIQTIPSALDKVQHLRGVTYDWKRNGKHDLGLIAEEVGEVIPEVVTYEANGKDAQSVDYARLVAVLIEAVKEQQKEIQAQRTLIDELRSEQKRISVLKAPDADRDTAALSQRLAALERMIGSRASNP